MEDNDTQLHLKKRARRRLVGAVAFAGFAAVVLPMIMDQEPHPAPQDVEIRIPGQDEKPFAPKFAASSQSSRPAETPPVPPVAPAPVEKPPVAAKVPEPAARVVEAVSPQEKPAAKAEEKAAEKPKSPEKPQKPAEKPMEKASEKPTEKPAEKSIEKPAKPEPKAKDAEAARVASILSGKPESAPPAAADGQYVILIGAFADQNNVKNLQTKLSELGIKVFTEPLDSPQGKKIRVRAGPFASKDAAEKALDKMKRIGVSGVMAAK